MNTYKVMDTLLEALEDKISEYIDMDDIITEAVTETVDEYARDGSLEDAVDRYKTELKQEIIDYVYENINTAIEAVLDVMSEE